jgi:hypothetical protein
MAILRKVFQVKEVLFTTRVAGFKLADLLEQRNEYDLGSIESSLDQTELTKEYYKKIDQTRKASVVAQCRSTACSRLKMKHPVEVPSYYAKSLLNSIGSSDNLK